MNLWQVLAIEYPWLPWRSIQWPKICKTLDFTGLALFLIKTVSPLSGSPQSIHLPPSTVCFSTLPQCHGQHVHQRTMRWLEQRGPPRPWVKSRSSSTSATAGYPHCPEFAEPQRRQLCCNEKRKNNQHNHKYADIQTPLLTNYTFPFKENMRKEDYEYEHCRHVDKKTYIGMAYWRHLERQECYNYPNQTRLATKYIDVRW